MKPAHKLELKVVPIGNSRGVRLPRELLTKYLIGDAVVVEEQPEGILLRSKRDRRFSWEQTYREMARAREDFSDLEEAVADGLETEPW